MIVAADIDGFVPGTCNLYMRNDISSEGASGTVGSEDFVEWVRHFLVPTLGNYARGEKRSIVIMDNASTHMCNEVEYLIESVGAVLLYTAPYSPDLNPIEMMFNCYKMYLKRHEIEFCNDYLKVHNDALNSVTSDIAIKEFRKCGVPHSSSILTSKETEKQDNDFLFLILILIKLMN